MRSTTGDLRNNLSKLLRQVRRMKMELTADLNGLVQGSPLAFLPIIHHSLMDYSFPLACWLAEEGFEMFGKSDLRFIESLYKVLRDVFQYIPVLTREQFLATGFAERKMIMTTDILILCQSKHHQLSQKSNQKKVVRKKRPLRVHQEVLTVHATCGLPSVCSEQVMTDVKVEEDDSVENIAPPINNAPTAELTFPTSKKCLETRYNGTTSLPLLKSHSPVTCSVVKYSDVTNNGVSYDLESVTSSELPSGGVDTPSDVPSMTIAPYSSPSPEGSWCSLLSAGTSPTHSRSSNTSPSLQSDDASPKHGAVSPKDDRRNDSPLLTGKVDQLTELVEKMSAKIILLETKLQLMEGSTKEKPISAGTLVEPSSLETSISTSISTRSNELTTPIAQAEMTHATQKAPHSIFLYRADSPETTQLIESLRNRAKQTKKLLAAAANDY